MIVSAKSLDESRKWQTSGYGSSSCYQRTWT